MTVSSHPLEFVESNLLLLDDPRIRSNVSASLSTIQHSSHQLLSKSWNHRKESTIARTDSKRVFRRLWPWWKGASNAQHSQNDLPPLSPFLDDDATLGRRVRSTNEQKLRCTEFDENGKITLVNGEFKKSELIAKYGLLTRDLRKIDSSFLPNILIRPSGSILINLLHLRVLIKYNRVLVFDAYGTTDSFTQSQFMYDLEGKLSTPETRTPGSSTVGAALPYEFRALEAVLISVTSGLEGEFEGVREPVVRVLRELEEDIDRDKLRQLLIYSKKLSSFNQKAKLVRDAIEDLLEADDDLAAMYLSEKALGKDRTEEDHTEIEMLLENYHKIADEIVQVSSNLVSNIRNTEEIVKAILDANRNSLMLLDLKFTIATLGLGTGTFFAALYGMNLKNFWEENDFAFVGVSVFSAIVGGIICKWGLKRLSRVQKVSMWGTTAGDTNQGRRGWGTIGDKYHDQPVGGGRRDRPRGVRESQAFNALSAKKADHSLLSRGQDSSARKKMS